MGSIAGRTSGVDFHTRADPLGLAGQQIGRFSIQSPIGVGGVATVYRAFDDVRGHSVALKVLHPDPDENTYTRFRREALNAGMLRHPHIVRIFQVGNTLRGGSAYIAMELVEGESLGQLLQRRHRLLSYESCTLLAPIARALSHAHESGIVHRDVKPSNILLRTARPGGVHSILLESIDHPVVPLLSDFGIARFLDEPELTFTGRTVGTPAYMAPEQCQGDRMVDGRADIYALGTVLYRCLTGHLPFHGSMTQILHAQIYDPVVVDAQIVRELPPTVLTILQRTLAKRPEDRYSSAMELAHDLHMVANRENVSTSDNMSTSTMSTMTATLELRQNARQTGDTQSKPITLVAGTDRESTHSRADTDTAIGAGQQPRPSLRFSYALALVLLLVAAGVGYMVGNRGNGQSRTPAAVTVDEPSPAAAVAVNAAAVEAPAANSAQEEPVAVISSLAITSIVTREQEADQQLELAAPSIPAVMVTVTNVARPNAPDALRAETPTNQAIETATSATPIGGAAGGPPIITPVQQEPPQVADTPLPMPSESVSSRDESAASVCMYVIDAFFVSKANAISDSESEELQCPTTGAYTTTATLLAFEHGHMLRLDETTQIYVYYAEANVWERTDDVSAEGAEPDPRPSDHVGLFVPTGDFGAVWADLQRNSALGYARHERPVSFTAIVQVFPGGILVGNVEDGRLFTYLRSRLKL